MGRDAVGASPTTHAGRSTDGRTSPEHATEETDVPDPIGDALDGWTPETQTNSRIARAKTRRATEHLRSVGPDT